MRIGGFVPVSFSDYPGKLSAVVFTAGCNFRCPFCHNWRLFANNVQLVTEEFVLQELANKIGKLDGVVVSGGEPTIQPDLEEFIDKIKSMDYLVKLDTNGSSPDVLDRLLPKLDFVAMDIKAPANKYNLLTGVDVNLEDVARSVELIVASSISYQFRTTWVKGLLSESDIKLLSDTYGSHYVVNPFVSEHAYDLMACSY